MSSAAAAAAEPYTDVHAHLRDEAVAGLAARRVQVRHRWEMGTLPRVSDDAALGVVDAR